MVDVLESAADKKRAYLREYHQKLRSTPEGREKVREAGLRATRKYRLTSKGDRALRINRDTWPKASIRDVRARAKKRGLPFNLTLADIVIPSICPVLGVPFVFGVGNHLHSPSIDRVVPSLGYVKGNVQVISRQANTMKSNCFDPEVFRRLLAYVESRIN